MNPEIRERLKWPARLTGVLALILFIIFLISAWDAGLTTSQLNYLVIFGAAGYAFGWVKAREGGIVMGVTAVVMALDLVYSRYDQLWWLLVVATFFWTVSAGLFLLYGRRDL
ncbi:MAG: hypothetical protein Kow00127_10170 [Bacteroidales bacterium]